MKIRDSVMNIIGVGGWILGVELEAGEESMKIELGVKKNGRV